MTFERLVCPARNNARIERVYPVKIVETVSQRGDDQMRTKSGHRARFVIGSGMLLAYVFTVMSGAVGGVPAVNAGEIMSDQKSSPSATASSGVSASASASASVSSASESDAGCKSKATASANARTGDKHVFDHDEQTAVGDDGECSASARATARTKQSIQDSPGE